VIGTGRADDRDVALGLGAQTFLDLDADDLQHVGEVDVVFDVIGRDILERSTELMRPGGTLVTIAMPPTVQPKNGKIHLLRRRTRPRPARRSFRSRTNKERSTPDQRFAPVLFQPIAGDDVAQAVDKIAAGSPLNGKVEVAAPEQFRMDEFFRSALAMRDDPRTVVTDPHANYVGTELGERTLLPGAYAILGEIRYSNWPGRTASGK
jgi:NADPH:quinone reductase-like Zn-dependent oxidoreductase